MRSFSQNTGLLPLFLIISQKKVQTSFPVIHKDGSVGNPMSLVDPRWVPGTHVPQGPNSFIFMQFSAKNLQNNRLAYPLWELVSPPQENPGSNNPNVTCLQFPSHNRSIIVRNTIPNKQFKQFLKMFISSNLLFPVPGIYLTFIICYVLQKC